MSEIRTKDFCEVLYVNGNNIFEQYSDNFTSSDLLVLKIDYFQYSYLERVEKAYLSVFYQNGIKGFDLTATVINCNDLSNATSIRNALNQAKLDTNNIIDKKTVTPHSLSEEYKTVNFDITNYFSFNRAETIELTIVIENNYQDYSSDNDKKFKLRSNECYLSVTELETSKSLINVYNGYVNCISGFFRHIISFNEIFSNELNIPFSISNYRNRKLMDYYGTIYGPFLMHNYEYFIYLDYKCLSANSTPTSNVIALSDYTGLVKYYSIIEYDSTIYNKLKIKYNKKCAYCNDGSYLYYENDENNTLGTYVLVLSNETKIFLKDPYDRGYLKVIEIIDKHSNSISFSYNVELNQIYYEYPPICLTNINNGQVLIEYETRDTNNVDKLLSKITFIESSQITREVNFTYEYDINETPSVLINSEKYISGVILEYKYKNTIDNITKLIKKEHIYYDVYSNITKIENYVSGDFSFGKLIGQTIIDNYENKTSSVTGFVKNKDEETFTKMFVYTRLCTRTLTVCQSSHGF